METPILECLAPLHDFPVSSASVQTVGRKLIDGMSPIRKTLKQINITNYSQKYTAVFVVFESFTPRPANSKQMQARTCLRRKTNVLEIYIPINYTDLLTADDAFTLVLLCDAYLFAIEKFLIPRKDFDGKRFYDDVKRLFEPFLQIQTA